jgi:hypothetical protein
MIIARIGASACSSALLLLWIGICICSEERGIMLLAAIVGLGGDIALWHIKQRLTQHPCRGGLRLTYAAGSRSCPLTLSIRRQSTRSPDEKAERRHLKALSALKKKLEGEGDD